MIMKIVDIHISNFFFIRFYIFINIQIYMENDKINDIILEFINNDYKFGYSFDYNFKYDHIINFWNFWYLREENEDLIEILDTLDLKLDKKIIEELEIIFRAHYNSTGSHMILFYITHSDEVLIKLKTDILVDKFRVPYWTIKISSQNIEKLMKQNKIKKNQLSILVYN